MFVLFGDPTVGLIPPKNTPRVGDDVPRTDDLANVRSPKSTALPRVEMVI